MSGKRQKAAIMELVYILSHEWKQAMTHDMNVKMLALCSCDGCSVMYLGNLLCQVWSSRGSETNVYLCVRLQRVSALQLWRSHCSDLLKTLAPTSAAHRPRGGETCSTVTRHTAQNRETKSDRAEAEPCTAALVLWGTQLGNTAQAPNSSNVCVHARGRVRELENF